MYNHTNGVFTPQIAEVLRLRTQKEDAVCVRFRCARCQSSDNIHIFDRRRFASCNSCGHIWERTVPVEAALNHSTYGQDRPAQLQRSGVSTAELNAKSGSVYCSMVHYRNFLLRLCGISIPQLSNSVWHELDRRLAAHGLLCPDPDDVDAQFRLNSYTFWFELLKNPIHTDNPPNLSPYYHYIYYFKRLYCHTDLRPLLSGHERSKLVSAFRCIRDYYIQHGKDIFTEFSTAGTKRPRKNLWSYGNITALLLRIMGRHDALISHSEILHEHYLVGGIESNAGRILHIIIHRLAPQLYKILKWPYMGHGRHLE